MVLSSDHRTAGEQWLQNNKKKNKEDGGIYPGTDGHSWVQMEIRRSMPAPRLIWFHG